MAPDLFYRFALRDRADVRVRVSPEGGYAPAVALRSGACRDGVEYVCGAEPPWAVTSAGLAAGEYLVLVDGSTPSARGRFTVTVEAQ